MPRFPLLKHFATWWKSRVTVHDGVLCPAGPFVPYDPFEFYVPYGEGNRHGLSLPFIFLEVDTTDDKAMAAFCSRYGMLGAQIQNTVDDGWPRSSGLNSDLRRLLNSPLAERDRELQSLQPAVRVHQLAQEATAIEVFVQTQRILRDVIQLATHESTKIPSDRQLIQHVFDRKTARAWPRLVWDQDDEQWCIGWNIDSLETALYLMLLFDVQSGASIRRCRNCQKLYRVDDPRAEHCSDHCQNDFKVNRYRRVERYAKHRGITKTAAREFLRKAGIDPSKYFDFATADLTGRRSHGTKKRQR